MQSTLIEDKFNAAVNVIRSLPKDGPYQPSHDMMLQFYGLYKQATAGPCEEPKPSFYEVVKGYKWKAWSSLGNMSKTEAMNTYVEQLKKIIETMSYSDNVAAFIEALGPFYEHVDIPGLKISDSNHNVTKQVSDRSDIHVQTDSFEVIPLCNGNGEINGKNSEGFIETQNAATNGLNGISSNTSNESDSRHSSEAPISSNAQMNPTMQVNGTSEESFTTIKRVPNDTEESDEEYLEPAETPELLRQKQQKQKVFKKDGPHDAVFVPDCGIATCGGGDDASVGRIRFTPSQNVGQGSRDGGANYEPSTAPFTQPSSYRSGGASGGRRGRDSDDARPPGRGGGSIDVNAQLILILQRIHQDLEAVVMRLDTLETRSLSEHQQLCQLCQRRMGQSFYPSEKNSWWPFPELSPRSTFFILTWPFILQGTVKLLLFLRSRRRKNF